MCTLVGFCVCERCSFVCFLCIVVRICVFVSYCTFPASLTHLRTHEMYVYLYIIEQVNVKPYKNYFTLHHAKPLQGPTQPAVQ